MASYPHRTTQVQFVRCPDVSLLGFLPAFASERCWNCYVQRLCHTLQHEPGIMWWKGNMTIADPCNGRGGGWKRRGRRERGQATFVCNQKPALGLRMQRHLQFCDQYGLPLMFFVNVYLCAIPAPGLTLVVSCSLYQMNFRR